MNNFSNAADEVSVASLRKGWEGKSTTKKEQQRSTPNKQAVPPNNINNNNAAAATIPPNSPFGVWEERANRLARLRRREQRREQKKDIEDRWMNHRGNDAAAADGERHRDGQGGSEEYGYQSEGQELVVRASTRAGHYDTGYQSEGGDRARRSHHHRHDSEPSITMEEQGQEVQYEDLLLEQQQVDSAPITVSDARRRLWDQKERLRAVLPHNEEGGGDVARDRWQEEQPSPHHSGIASPGNYSASSGGGRFKSKFVHAAALAAQQRRTDFSERDEREHRSPSHSQARSTHTQQQQQQREYEETKRRNQQQQRAAVEAQQQLDYAEKQKQKKRQQQQLEYEENQKMAAAAAVQAQQHQLQQQQQQRDYHASKKHYQKHAAVSSHYTDSTAETTTVVTTTPSGSFSSSHRHRATPAAVSASSAVVQQQQISNAMRTTTSNVVRKVSPSPPKRPQAHAGNATMPPIAEQVGGAASSSQAQTATASSVAALIARINAVSRSNPEEALAAIDSILNREGVVVAGNNGTHAALQEISRTAAGSAAPTKNKPSLFSPSRVITPSSSSNNNKANGNNNTAVRHLGKDFFQEKYEEVLQGDCERIAARGAAADAAPNAVSEREDDHGGGEDDDDYDDDDDSLLSSDDDSTVSSMTNPTYASLRSEQVPRRKKKHHRDHHHPPIVAAQRRRPSRDNNMQRSSPPRQQQMQQPDSLPMDPQKSWNTLKREYTERKSPDRHHHIQEENDDTARRDDIVAASRASSSEEDKFSPDDEQFRRIHEYNQRRQQQQHAALPPSPPSPPTPSTLTNAFGNDSDWVPIPKKSGIFGNTHHAENNERRENVGVRSRGGGGIPPMRQHQGTTSRPVVATRENSNHRWPSTGNALPGNTTGDINLGMPHLIDQPNTKTAPQPIKRDQPANRAVPPKARGNATATTPPNRNANVPRKRASTPDIMMAVSDAFSNVDISLDGGNPTTDDDDPQLQSLESSEDEAADQLQSLQTISEAFSDVDVSFGQQEKTVSQRRKELEYLARSWTASKSQSHDDDDRVATQAPKAVAPATKAAWARASSRLPAMKQKKNKAEPTLRLRGNKSLAKKFASLVKAYDD